jgi:hypothetical protein
MGMLDFIGGGRSDDDEMAAKSHALNAEAIERHLALLKAVTYDREAFQKAYQALVADKAMTAVDMVELARRYTCGARTPSKKAAILAIGQERSRLALAKAKAESAARAKTW